MITAGIDIGSLSAEAVILKDGEILSWSLIRTGPDSAQTAHRVMDEALTGADLKPEDVQYIVSTGYGRIIVPFAQKNITEISCHAKGANWFFPGARPILDMGGQDCKAIRCDPQGKVKNFAMNDKCAAGTGRYMEVMADLLELSLEEIGQRSLEIEGQPPTISSMCVVFAKSEVLALDRKGIEKNQILAGSCEAIAERVCALMNVVETEPDLVITGGIAKNVGVVQRIEKRLGTQARICFEPQICGALGAAVLAGERLEKARKKG